LHVLSPPLTFALSQDQTLHRKVLNPALPRLIEAIRGDDFVRDGMVINQSQTRKTHISICDLLSSFQRPIRDESIDSSRPHRLAPVEVGAFTLCLPVCQLSSIFYFELGFGPGRPSIDWLLGLSFEPRRITPSRVGASTPCLPFCQPFRSFFRSGPVSEGLRLIGLSAFLSAPGDLRRRGMLLIGDQFSVVN
jgi:hypothetical protein